MNRLLTIATCASLAASCGGGAGAGLSPRRLRADMDNHARGPLVVLVIYDQLAHRSLRKLLPSLAPEGALRRAATSGVYFPRVRYPYAGTFTAPGHATIHTGAAPIRHGVTTNARWDYRRGARVQAIDDGEHAVLGRPDAHAGPALLRAENLAAALKRQTQGAAKVVSLSLKDRAAILGAGGAADLALWYEPKLPGFTTSTAYAQALPAWLSAWQRGAPLAGLLGPWTTPRGARWQAELGPDEQPGEGDWGGLGVVFPHEIAPASQPYSILRATPQLGERLIELAARSVDALALGRDAVPDLLAISVSGTDYVGHALGPDSWEYAEHLYRVDLALGRFLERLSTQARVSVVITADHGAAPTPEVAGRGGRVSPDALVEELDAAVDAALGPGRWVQGYFPPFLFLTPAARARPNHRRAIDAAMTHLRAQRAFDGAYEVAALLRAGPPADPARRAAYLSCHADTDADLLLVPAPNWVVDTGMAPGAGSTHGTPHDYDALVPVLVHAAGVPPRVDAAEYDMRQVAPTVAALLGIAPPAASRHAALPIRSTGRAP